MVIDNVGRVGINETSLSGNDAKLIIDSGDGKHPAIKVNDGGANGFTMLADNYTATESQFNIGVGYSGGQGVISHNCKVSDAANNVFLSSNAQGATKPMALCFDAGDFVFRNTDTSATISVDTEVPITERMRIASDGVVEIKKTSGGELLLYSTDTSLVADQLIGSLGFYKSDASGAGAGVSASIQVRSDSSIGAKSYMAFHTDNSSGSQNVERMRIDSLGRVGIGDTSPAYKLDINETGTSTYVIHAQKSGTSLGGLYVTSGSDAQFYLKAASNSTKVLLNTDGNSYFDGGNVGIGETSPSAKLHIKTSSVDNLDQVLIESTDSGTGSGPDLAFYRNSSSPADGDNLGAIWFYGKDSSGNQQQYSAIIGSINDVTAGTEDSDIKFWNTSGGTLSERMRLQYNGDLHADGDVVAYSTTISDARLKDNVKPLESSLDKIMNLKGVEYTWNNGSRKGQKDIGFIAQEVEDVIPEIVREKEVLFDEDTKYKTVDYEKITAVLVEAVKELKQEIVELKKQII